MFSTFQLSLSPPPSHSLTHAHTPKHPAACIHVTWMSVHCNWHHCDSSPPITNEKIPKYVFSLQTDQCYFSQYVIKFSLKTKRKPKYDEFWIHVDFPIWTNLNCLMYQEYCTRVQDWNTARFFKTKNSRAISFLLVIYLRQSYLLYMYIYYI